MTTAALSIGVAGTLGPTVIARIAAAAEQAGLHAVWVNDTPGGDALAALAAAARSTSTLVLATGVLPMDRHSVEQIVRAVRDQELPEHRLVLGIGSGSAGPGALATVGTAAQRLRADTGARVMVGALGPRMRALAAASGGPLLSWLTAQAAADQAGQARAAAAGAHVALYVRTSLDAAAAARLEAETARYAMYPKYAANFARLGIDPADTVLDVASIGRRLSDYRAAVDEVVLRAITPGDGLDDYLRFVAQAEPLLAGS